MANKEKPRYNGKCREVNKPVSDKTVVRFKTPIDGAIHIGDLVKGEIVVANKELDDLVIARADGSPTYNLTVVVDDMDMQITHVIRGDDHINNTPRQINILNALDAKLPAYAHLPMILGSDGARLSKRHGAVSVMQFRDEGYLPQALLNYLVRLGWSHGDQEIFSIDEMISYFELADVNGAASTFNMEKLLWLNHHYLMHSDPNDIAPHLTWHLAQLGIDAKNELVDILELIKAQRERCKTLVEMANASVYLRIMMKKRRKKHLLTAVMLFLLRFVKHFQPYQPGKRNYFTPSSKTLQKNWSLGLVKLPSHCVLRYVGRVFRLQLISRLLF